MKSYAALFLLTASIAGSLLGGANAAGGGQVADYVIPPASHFAAKVERHLEGMEVAKEHQQWNKYKKLAAKAQNAHSKAEARNSLDPDQAEAISWKYYRQSHADVDEAAKPNYANEKFIKMTKWAQLTVEKKEAALRAQEEAQEAERRAIEEEEERAAIARAEAEAKAEEEEKAARRRAARRAKAELAERRKAEERANMVQATPIEDAFNQQLRLDLNDMVQRAHRSQIPVVYSGEDAQANHGSFGGQSSSASSSSSSQQIPGMEGRRRSSAASRFQPAGQENGFFSSPERTAHNIRVREARERRTQIYREMANIQRPRGRPSGGL